MKSIVGRFELEDSAVVHKQPELPELALDVVKAHEGVELFHQFTRVFGIEIALRLLPGYARERRVGRPG